MRRFRPAFFLAALLSASLLPPAASAARRVVIDPARGGDDVGYRNPKGMEEKAVLLAFAKELAELLEERGYEVELTRGEDKTLTPSDRAATANRRAAACFLSIEAMGVGRPEAKGFEVFYPPAPPAGTDPALWRAGQAAVGAESRRLAETLHRLLAERIATYDRGVRELPSPLLSAVACPAALVVAGNLSWPQEAELLTEPGGRARLAAALADAIDLFFHEEGGASP